MCQAVEKTTAMGINHPDLMPRNSLPCGGAYSILIWLLVMLRLNVGQIHFHSSLYKRRHDSDPSGNSRCNYSTDDSPLVVVGGLQRECEISYISGTCSYLGVSRTPQIPGLSGIWRNPGGVGLIVGNYGNDCVL